MSLRWEGDSAETRAARAALADYHALPLGCPGALVEPIHVDVGRSGYLTPHAVGETGTLLYRIGLGMLGVGSFGARR